jgi:alpha-beta hydrolase superfamily lysophospholipase
MMQQAGLTASQLKTEPLSIASATGQGFLRGDLYWPSSQPLAGLLIVHGMSEHRKRYDPFAAYLAMRGFLVLTYDQAGHGESVPDHSQLGFFALKEGDRLVREDTAAMLAQLNHRLDARPIFILGHSMGSLIVRDFMAQDQPMVSGVILTGTAGPNPALPVGRAVAKLLVKLKGPHHRSVFLDRLLHLGYLSRIANPRTEYDWLSRDLQRVRAYIEDPLCGYQFTVAALLDMMAWTDRVNKPAWASRIDPELPVLLTSGDQDPVGQYTAGVRKVHDWLKAQNRPVTLRFYEGARHEILNETNRLAVHEDLFEWMRQLC